MRTHAGFNVSIPALPSHVLLWAARGRSFNSPERVWERMDPQRTSNCAKKLIYTTREEISNGSSATLALAIPLSFSDFIFKVLYWHYHSADNSINTHKKMMSCIINQNNKWLNALLHPFHNDETVTGANVFPMIGLQASRWPLQFAGIRIKRNDLMTL